MTKRLAPVHPGEVLLEEFLEPMGLEGKGAQQQETRERGSEVDHADPRQPVGELRSGDGQAGQRTEDEVADDDPSLPALDVGLTRIRAEGHEAIPPTSETGARHPAMLVAREGSDRDGRPRDRDGGRGKGSLGTTSGSRQVDGLSVSRAIPLKREAQDQTA